jgi:hypothetical protein
MQTIFPKNLECVKEKCSLEIIKFMKHGTLMHLILYLSFSDPLSPHQVTNFPCSDVQRVTALKSRHLKIKTLAVQSRLQ